MVLRGCDLDQPIKNSKQFARLMPTVANVDYILIKLNYRNCQPTKKKEKRKQNLVICTQRVLKIR